MLVTRKSFLGTMLSAANGQEQPAEEVTGWSVMEHMCKDLEG